MSQQNVEVMRAVYERSSRDPYAVLELLTPNAEWHAEAGGPLEAIYIGPEEARQWIDQMLEVFEAHRVEPHEFVAVGDHVVVPVRVWARARGTGLEAEVEIVHAWRLRGGRIVWTRSYPNKAQALEALDATNSKA